MAEPPPDLAHLKLLEWVRQHPAGSYLPQHPPSDAEIFGKTGVAIGLEILGHLVEKLHPVGWLHLAYEIFESMAHRAEMEELPQRRKEAQHAEFRQYMWDKFWTDPAMYDSSAVREAAFDKYVGDHAGHATVPALTPDAEAGRNQLMDAVSDRWLDRTEKLSELQERVDAHEKDKPNLATDPEHQRNLADAAGLRKHAEELRQWAASPDSTRWVKDPGHMNGGYEVSIHHEEHRKEAARLEQQAKQLENTVPGMWEHRKELYGSELQAQKEMMVREAAKDVQSVKDFESNPAHWQLTPDQQSILTSKMQPEDADERSDDDRFYDAVGGRPN